jgi:hypothetical protein
MARNPAVVVGAKQHRFRLFINEAIPIPEVVGDLVDLPRIRVDAPLDAVDTIGANTQARAAEWAHKLVGYNGLLFTTYRTTNIVIIVTTRDHARR